MLKKKILSVVMAAALAVGIAAVPAAAAEDEKEFLFTWNDYSACVSGLGQNNADMVYNSFANLNSDNLGCSEINAMTTTTKTALLEDLQNSSYWVLLRYSAWELDFQTSLLALNGASQNLQDMLLFSEIEALPDNALSHVKLVILAANGSAEGGAQADNLATLLKSKGVQNVIGFESEIADFTNRYVFSSTIPVCLSQGMDVEESITFTIDLIEEMNGQFGLDAQMLRDSVVLVQ